MTVDVLIPAYRPDRRFARLLQMLSKQTVKPRRIIVVNTEESYWNEEGYKGIRGLEVHHVTKAEFDHGGTRNLAAWYSEAEIMIFMTQDAVPQDEYLIEELLKAFEQTGPHGEVIAQAYARQLPAKGFQLSGSADGQDKGGFGEAWDQDLFCIKCLLCIPKRYFRGAGGIYHKYDLQ